jgi:glucose-6-phosphate 1-dehydrogenase
MSYEKPDSLSIVVIGASGDLARKKIYPALFSLFCQGFLPESTNIYGFARSQLEIAEFRERILSNLTCRYTPEHNCAEMQARFLERCEYISGNYGEVQSYLDLYEQMYQRENSRSANRIYYFAIPPSVFMPTAQALADTGLINKERGESWSRVVLEKPFGHDRESADELSAGIARLVDELDVYRIDHYLGKEAIQNLMALRFANLVFEPVWNSRYIDHICIDWKEQVGLAGRAGYFDDYGIIRDVVQNHLLQILSLIAMERPQSLAPHDVRDEKLKVLQRIHPPALENICIGQYQGDDDGHVGYLEEEGVPPDSITPTYAAVVLRVDNDRWRGVPFILTAGKALDDSSTEVRIHFKEQSENIFRDSSPTLEPNMLTIRVQPDEALFLNFNTKKPGLGSEIIGSSFDFVYQSNFDMTLPEAYERLLLDVIRGDKSLFIRADELAAAWDIFTPVLHRMERERIAPKAYRYGSARPHILENIL